MKKELKDKIIEISSYLICLAIILAIGYFTGYLKGFTPSDFENAYYKITYDLSNTEIFKNQNIKFSKKNCRNNNSSRHSKYRINKIPEAVIRGVNSSGVWTNIFNSNKKTVFYIYDDNSISFDNSIKNYVNSENLSSKYNIVSYTTTSFGSVRLGDIGPSEICKNLQECNANRQKASDYTTLSEFLKQCGRTACIINPTESEYIRLNSRNIATSAIYSLQNW